MAQDSQDPTTLAWLGVARPESGAPHLARLIDGFELLGVINDIEGKIWYANPAFLRRTGWSLHEIVGRSYFDVFFDDEQAEVLKSVFLPVIGAGETPSQLENEILDRSGQGVLVSWHNSILFNGEGEPVGLLSFGEDVGYRRRSVAVLKGERELLSALSRGRSTSECAAILLGLLEAQGGARQAWLALRPRVGRPWVFDKSGHDTSTHARLESVLHVLAEIERLSAPEQRSVDGQEWWFEPVLDESGATLGAVLICTDTGSLSHGLRDLLRRLTPLAKLLIEQDKRVHGRDGLLRVMNPSVARSPFERCLDYFQRVYGIESGVVLCAESSGEGGIERRILGEGVDWEEWVESCGGLAALVAQSRRPGLGVGELADGRGVLCAAFQTEEGLVGVLLLAVPQLLPFQGLVRLAMSVLSRWLAASLSALEAERARSRIEERALQAQKLESLGVLAGGIAHDFNNMLTGILGNASLALRALPPGSPVAELVRDIEVAGMRTAELTRQMLAYSGRGRFVIEPVDLSVMVQEMYNLLRAVISKNAVIKLQLQPGLPKVMADATQLRQVVMNLITNASDAVGERSGYIAVKTGLTWAEASYLRETYLDDDLAEGEYVFLEVTDTGCGMDSATRERIFEPFFSTKFTGRGLGLAAVLGIVRSHGGALKLYSEPERGTTFKVLLPVRTPEQMAEVELPELEPVRVHGGAGVLVVDDDESARAVARRMLSALGHAVFTAADGEQAVQVYRASAQEIQVVLLDLTMPHMDGSATFSALRTIDPAVRVVLTSGYNEQEATSHLVGKGLAGFIQKPYRLKDLEAVIAVALEGNGAKGSDSD